MTAHRVVPRSLAAAAAGLVLGALLGCAASNPAGGGGSGRDAARHGTQLVAVDDLAVRVPAEWRRLMGNTHGVYMVDPRHANTAVSFSIFTSALGSGWGLMNEAFGGLQELRSNPMYSHVTVRSVHLPGVRAFEFGFRATLERGVFLGRKYVVVHRGRIYWITYEWSPQEAEAHSSQIRTSVSSLRYVRGPYDPDIQTVVVTKTPADMLAFRIVFRRPTRLTAAHKLEVFLDTDGNAKTGASGAEYVLDYSRSTAELGNGRTRTFSTPKSLRFTADARSATFRISRSDLGNPDRFGFFVSVGRGSGVIDQAPLDGIADAEWMYPARSSTSATVRYTSA